MDRACERFNAAEHRLIRASPGSADQFAAKFEVLESMISYREGEAYMADHRHILMLAALKADVCRFGSW